MDADILMCVDCQRGEHEECRRFGITCPCDHGSTIMGLDYAASGASAIVFAKVNAGNSTIVGAVIGDDAQEFDDIFEEPS